MIMRRSEPAARVVVPDHKHLRAGTLRHILTDAGLSIDDLLKLL